MTEDLKHEDWLLLQESDEEVLDELPPDWNRQLVELEAIEKDLAALQKRVWDLITDIHYNFGDWAS